MASIKNVTIVGGAGDLGSALLKSLVDSGKFNVTALTRPTSTSTFPASVKVTKADYNSVDELTSALKGQDALVLALGTNGLSGQDKFIDAAIASGVKRIIPSEFGCDLNKAGSLPVFGFKIATRKHLEGKIAAGADITYTYVINNAFLDWGLEKNFLVDWKSEAPTLYNGGDFVFSATTLASVGQAVVGVLTHLDETKNRSVYVEDIGISQNQLLALARKVAPSKKWTPTTVDLAKIEEQCNEAVSKGDYSASVMINYLVVAMYQNKYGGRPEKLDNELLGVKGKTEADVEAILKGILGGN
ncbi:hypothetical protein LZ554_008744 [Drepanopeziza brunnea f. sp. 'monogermtubi']|nr:hypothetical protein LZ554_008744 [Drepanopeziza brunnea f. sp. 'monogermtubi']